MGGENLDLNTQAGLLADVHMDDAQCHIDVLSPTGVFTDADLNEVAGETRSKTLLQSTFRYQESQSSHFHVCLCLRNDIKARSCGHLFAC